MADQNLMAPKEGSSEEILSLKRTAMESQKRRRLRRCKSAPQNADPTIDPVDKTLKTKLSSSPPFPLLLPQNLLPTIKTITFCLSVYISVGVICFYVVRNQLKGKHTNAFVDSLYVTIITMTTVGYGDLTPDSVATKLLACAFVFTGMAICGAILSRGADYLVDKQEVLLVKALHSSHEISPNDTLKEIKTKRVWYKFIITLALLLLLIIIGTLFLVFVEGLPLIDGFYCVVATVTTLGYGLPAFNSVGGRVFATFWILMSTITVALVFLYFAELSTEKKRKELVKLVLTRQMTDVDIEAADIDRDQVVNAAEFVVYKLKEMGKADSDDIDAIMKEFQELDVDQSGFLNLSDLAMARSTSCDPPSEIPVK